MRNFRKGILYIVLVVLSTSLVACQAPPQISVDKRVTQVVEDDSFILLKDIAQKTPSHLKYEFQEPNFGWSINADVIIPDNLERFDIICSGLGEAPDFDAVLASSVIPPELAKAPSSEDAEAINFITMMVMPSQRRLLETQQMIRGETYEVITHLINCASGVLKFSQPCPDDYDSNISGATGRGELSLNGIAKDCAVSADQSKEMALKFLAELPLPFRYEAGQASAFSPGAETSLSKGFYQVQIKQTLDGKPIAVANGSNQLSLGEEIGAKYVPPITGSWIDVFEFGVQSVNLQWFANEFEVIENVEKLLPLSVAIEVIEELLATTNRPSPEANYLMASIQSIEDGFVVNSIRLEYAAIGCDGERVLLTPCWNFEGVSPATLFRGIRINAVTGDVLLVCGSEGDGSDG